MSWQEFWTLFHKRWGSDHESPEYVKAEWSQMQMFLEMKQRKEEGVPPYSGDTSLRNR